MRVSARQSTLRGTPFSPASKVTRLEVPRAARPAGLPEARPAVPLPDPPRREPEGDALFALPARPNRQAVAPAVQPFESRRLDRASSVLALLVPDLPSWAARQLDPRLDELPVIVASGTRVVGADAKARAAGVRVPDALHRARALCPEGQVVEQDDARERLAWEAAVQQAYTFTPFLDSPQPGLLYAGQLEPLEAEALSQALKAQAGLAVSRGTALLAAARAGGGTVNVAADEAAFIAATPVRALLAAGLPGEVIERLELFGLRFVGDLRRFTPRQLRAQFGPDAPRLAALASGEDRAPLPAHRPAVELRGDYRFEWPVMEPADIDPVLEHLSADLSARLGERAARVITLRLDTPLGLLNGRRLLKGGSREPRAVFRAARLALQDTLPPGLELSALTLTLGGLFKPEMVQDALFGAWSRPGVREAIRAVSTRYPGGVGRMIVHEPLAYLPERRFRYQAFTPAQAGPEARPAPGRRAARTGAA
ncbi:MAG TPA: hypothetical protein VHN99_04165, partial [Deinococcales bacterium]|nr:hypothetical protein [Deinococcales bacterium]